jgi:hypothetical protein
MQIRGEENWIPGRQQQATRVYGDEGDNRRVILAFECFLFTREGKKDAIRGRSLGLRHSGAISVLIINLIFL